MKDKIIYAIKSEIEYLKKQSYWEDICSFCLYTDEDATSLSLLFNTTKFYDLVVDKEYLLTYKFMPSEWFSETLKLSDDEKIYSNHFFKEIEEVLRNKESNFYYNDFLDAMKHCVEHQIFPKKDHFIFLVMRSDCYDGESIFNENKQFNTINTMSELEKFIKTEL